MGQDILWEKGGVQSVRGKSRAQPARRSTHQGRVGAHRKLQTDNLETGDHGGWQTGTRDLLYYSLCFCVFVKFPPNKALEKNTDKFIVIQKQQNAEGKKKTNKPHPHFSQKKITESQELKSLFCNPQGKT